MGTKLTLPGGQIIDLGIPIVTHKEWGAKYDYAERHESKPATIRKNVSRLHTTVTIAPDLVPPFDDEHAAMRTLERIGVERFKSGVSYAFCIMPNGNIYEGQPLNNKQTQSGHNATANTFEVGIAFVGNYEKNNAPAGMLDSACRLQAALRHNGLIKDEAFRWHQQVANKACPGRHVIDDIPAMNLRTKSYLSALTRKDDAIMADLTDRQLAEIADAVGRKLLNWELADPTSKDPKNPVKKKVLDWLRYSDSLHLGTRTFITKEIAKVEKALKGDFNGMREGVAAELRNINTQLAAIKAKLEGTEK